jgi:hypothetical protein
MFLTPPTVGRPLKAEEPTPFSRQICQVSFLIPFTTVNKDIPAICRTELSTLLRLDFDDPDDRKGKTLQVLGAPFRFPDTPLGLSNVVAIAEKSRRTQLSQTFPASRAPPRIV